MYHTKIRGEVRPVNTYTLHALDSGIVREERQTYSSSGTSVPPDELHARQIARESMHWIEFTTEHTRMRPATIQRKGLDAACFSVLKRTSSLAIPTKLSGTGAHQHQLWAMVRNRVPAWTELALDVGEDQIAVLYDETEIIGAIQNKHVNWVRPLFPFGARLYLSKVTGSERSGYTLGVNVVVGHVGHALDRLLDALGEAGLGGDGASGDGSARHLRLVTPERQAGPGADPADVVLYREIDGTARATVEHAVRHSPTGIEWGYAGSGPADLARSILLGFTDEGTADRLYQRFKAEVVAAVPRGGGVIRASDVRAWLAAHAAKSD